MAVPSTVSQTFAFLAFEFVTSTTQSLAFSKGSTEPLAEPLNEPDLSARKYFDGFVVKPPEDEDRNSESRSRSRVPLDAAGVQSRHGKRIASWHPWVRFAEELRNPRKPLVEVSFPWGNLMGQFCWYRSQMIRTMAPFQKAQPPYKRDPFWAALVGFHPNRCFIYIGAAWGHVSGRSIQGNWGAAPKGGIVHSCCLDTFCLHCCLLWLSGGNPTT